jgi:hypothetical protein
MAAEEEYKYNTTPKGLYKTLKKYGVAVIPRVLDEKECDEMLSKTWDFYEHITQDWDTPIDRDNEKSWRSFYDLFPLHSMLIQHHGIGHAGVNWWLRQNIKIVQIYALLWKCDPEDLLVSFDGNSLHMPPEITNKGWHRKTWHHTDQNLHVEDLQCVQSWVTALDVEEGDATLSVLEGSHKIHGDFGETLKTKVKGNWYKLSAEEQEYFTSRGCEEVRIKCPKGSMVFWDSRTIHCGVEAVKGRPRSTFRCVTYLCYEPRDNITDANLRKKVKAFEENRTTSHWPCYPKLFGKNPRTYGAELKTITPAPKPEMTPLGMRLAGYD